MNSMGNRHKELDEQWLALILQAKQLGLTTEEVRAFFLELQANGKKG